MNDTLIQYYRCPENSVTLSVKKLSGDRGFFKVGPSAIGYGRVSENRKISGAEDALEDLSSDIEVTDAACELPFDPCEVVDNLRLERYVRKPAGTSLLKKVAKSAYYTLRPLLPVAVRKHLQRTALQDWKRIRFPRWPLDCSVESLMKVVLSSGMRSAGIERLPFIWFWPEGHQGCVMMTHDVETATGRDFCGQLMKINDDYGFKSSFQLIPEERYEVPVELLDGIRDAGFEVCIHGLNHDGKLFWSREEFRRRARAINAYAKEFGAKGFRSPVLYRNLDWFEDFEFEYDMSVPNVGHLDPQRGGCCTVMPFFMKEIVELPLTATQDYALFHFLRMSDIDLWKRQIAGVAEESGLVSFIVHPDYILGRKPQSMYKLLLEHLSEVCERKGLWKALPGDINTWWRQRSRMRLVAENGVWKVTGPGSERARVAYAVADGRSVGYEVEAGKSVRER